MRFLFPWAARRKSARAMRQVVGRERPLRFSASLVTPCRDPSRLPFGKTMGRPCQGLVDAPIVGGPAGIPGHLSALIDRSSVDNHF